MSNRGEQTLSLYVASDEVTQLDGVSKILVNLGSAIDLRGTKSRRISAYQVTLPYSFINISAFEANNVMIIRDVTYAITYTLTFPDGCYSLDSIQNYIYDALLLLDPNYDRSSVFTFNGIAATGYIKITYPDVTTPLPQYQWLAEDPLDSIHTTLGFDATALPLPPLGESILYIAQNTSLLNRDIQNCLVACSLVSDASVNGRQSNVIASITPDTQTNVGQVILYSPSVPIWCKLNTEYFNQFTLTLYQNDASTLMRICEAPPNIQNTNWQILLVISYYLD